MTKTEQQVKAIVEPFITNLGYSLYDVMYLKEGSEWFLRIFIDKPEGLIDLDDCEKVNNAITDELDKADPIVESYNLEVSSCGLERVIREPEHYNWAIGKKISIKFFKAQDGVKELEGTLKEFDGQNITLVQENGNEVKVELNSNIASCKNIYNWEDLKNE